MPSSPPPAGSPRDMTAMPQRSEVLHTLFENYMQEVYLMPVLRNKPTLYERLIIRKISQSYQPHPYTQCHTEGPYYLNTPDQQGRKYRGGRWGCPIRLLSHLSPQRPDPLSWNPNQRCGKDIPTDWRRCRPCGPRDHRYLCPQNICTKSLSKRTQPMEGQGADQ